VQATSSSSPDEREDPQLFDEDEAERRPIRVVVDTSSDEAERRPLVGDCQLQASSSSLIFIDRQQSIYAILTEQRPSSTGCHHLPWSDAKDVLDRPPWSGDIIISRQHWRDGLIRVQLQQGTGCTIDRKAMP
jgi:hypothetical protein